MRPGVIAYLDPTHKPEYPRPQRLCGSVLALLFIVVTTAAALALHIVSPGTVTLGVFAIPFLWVGGGWYVFARVTESRSPDAVKAFKLLGGVLGILLAPFVICDSPTDASVLTYFLRYGWHSGRVGDFGRFGLGALAALLLIFALADVVDLMLRWRRWRRSRQVSL